MELRLPKEIDALENAIRELNFAHKLISSSSNKQIRRKNHRSLLKATAYTWFTTHRLKINSTAHTSDLKTIDQMYHVVLYSTEHSATKSTYIANLKDINNGLVRLRTAFLASPNLVASTVNSEEVAPDFSVLASNPEMREVLTRRWNECSKCVNAAAHLAAIVMMGGLLEALFVARANAMSDKGPLLKAKSVPIDKISKKPSNFQTWMLDSHINVGHELGWISSSAKQIAVVIKDYRNYVHPEKELRHQVKLDHNDSALFWQLTKELVRQLLSSVKK